MSVVEIVICTVFGIAFAVFIGGAAAWLWIMAIKEWRDME